MAFESRHTEFFGPDLARGPVLSGAPEVAAIQVATQLAQLRTPLKRSDTDIESHADFIRALADRLFPDYAAAIEMSVAAESSNNIDTLVQVATGNYTLLHCWLADSTGGGQTATSPGSVTWLAGTVLQTITTNKQYLVLTNSDGFANVRVNYTGDNTWYWGMARHGRVYYSTQLNFD